MYTNKTKKGVGGNRVVKRENFLIVAFSRLKTFVKDILKGFEIAERNRDKNMFGKL